MIEATAHHLGSRPASKLGDAIPFVPALELYSDLILPRLADGPKTLAALDVPLYAMQHLERAGLVKSRRETVTLTTGKLAIQVWYRAEDFPAKTPSSEPVDCATMTFEASN
jgi:hypothetical protein